MALHFGKTWWGDAWLRSLTDIDYANRIPRGASYARKGSVLNICISAGKIQACVQGSRQKPYKVEIGVK